MKKITPFLWFDSQAEEAARFYVSVFKKSKLGAVRRGNGVGRTKGPVMSASFTVEGQDFIAFNGGPHFHFTPAISLYVDCKDQKEVDTLWKKLGAGGTPSRCGWLQDRYGVSWQIIPADLPKLLQDKDSARAARAMAAMMGMVKIDVAALHEAAGAGVPARRPSRASGGKSRRGTKK